jgi:hypothetical protein
MEGTPKHFVLHEFSESNVGELQEWQNARSGMTNSTSALYQSVVQAP